MKTYLKKTTMSILTIMFLATISKAQDIVVKVKALHDSVAVSLDSIYIINESNNSKLSIGNLAQGVTEYSVNLNKASIVTGIAKVATLSQFSIHGANYGFDITSSLDKPDDVSVSVYSLDGKLMQSQKIYASAGFNTYSFHLLSAGMFLVDVRTSTSYQAFKVFFNQNAPTAVADVTTESGKTKSMTTDFSFTTGDRIHVVVTKGKLRSGTWMGRPANGNYIVLALPKTGAIFDMKQTLSSGAQINTISFSGVAFYSGCFYASSFYPPGKVADYFGFQYMRDNDFDESGHNTDFLTKAAYHTMHILDSTQMKVLINLAVEQEKLFNAYALKRLVLIRAFHRYLDNDLPIGKTTLNIDSVKKISKELYLIDAEISYGRSIKFAQVINSLTEQQRDTLYRLGTLGMRTWPMPAKPQIQIPKGMNTWVMSNASELFSWFLRGADAGIYFCPERQGTYFGGFYMKDAPAVGTPGYEIDPQATANKGAFMLDSILTASQSKEIKDIYTMVKPSLDSIVLMRTKITIELRKSLNNQTVNKNDINAWSAKYGEYDGNYIFAMVEQFVKVGRTLTAEQKNRLTILRNLENFPCKAGKVFLFSSEIDEPTIPNTDFLFK